MDEFDLIKKYFVPISSIESQNLSNDGIPNHNKQSPIFLGVPAPEPSPWLICPDSPEHGADQAEEQGEAGHAKDHRTDGFGGLFFGGNKLGSQ